MVAGIGALSKKTDSAKARCSSAKPLSAVEGEHESQAACIAGVSPVCAKIDARARSTSRTSVEKAGILLSHSIRVGARRCRARA